MKLKTLKRAAAFFLLNNVLAGTNFFEAKRKLLNFAGNEIGEGTKIVGPIYCSGKLSTGKDCWIGRGFSLEGNGSVTFGDNCDVGPKVTFLTGGHEIGTFARRAGKGEIYHIRVGSGSWICAGATLGKNIKIGKGCVIAAGAVVMNDVEENVLAGGVPARTIRYLDENESYKK